MPIDLLCTGCSRPLRAPDEQAGKSVRCPHCEAINHVAAPGDSLVQAELASPFAPQAGYPRPLGDDPALRMLLPVGRSIWAIAAGYFGLFAVLGCPAPITLILAIVAIVHLRRNPKLHGWGRAIFGLVMGIIGSAFLVLGLIAILAERR